MKPKKQNKGWAIAFNLHGHPLVVVSLSHKTRREFIHAFQGGSVGLQFPATIDPKLMHHVKLTEVKP